MKFLELYVRPSTIVHGFDDDNREIVEKFQSEHFTCKLVAIERILSVSEQYLLVSAAHGRVMYWEYEETYDNIRDKLKKAGALIA